jgi:hypothetical protein
LLGERKERKTQKIDHRWQFKNYQPTRAPLCGRGHDCASREMMDGIDAAYSLVRVEHAPAVFRLKNKK